MLRILSKVIACFTVLCLLFAGIVFWDIPVMADSANLITNPGFESGTTGWTLGSVFTLDGMTTHSGANSIKLTGKGTWQPLKQNVSVTPNTNYTLSFYAEGPSGVIFKILNSSGGTITLNNKVTASDTWTLNTLTFNSGSNSTLAINILDGDSTGGTHYFDDFLIVPAAVSTEPGNLLINPGFEPDTAGWMLGSVFTLDSTTAHSGTNSVKLKGGATWQSLMQCVNVTPNTNYTLSFYAKGPSGVIFKVMNMSSQAITSNYNVIAGNAWTLNTLTFNSGSNSTVVIGVMDGDSTGSAHYFDDFAMALAPVPLNLIFNPGFEPDTTGWTLGSAYTLNSTTAHSGTNSVKLTGACTWQPLNQYINVTPNTYYTLSFYAKGPSGVIFKILTTSNTAITPNYSVIASDTWTLNTLTFSSGSNSTVALYIGDGDSTGNAHYFDDFVMAPAAVPVNLVFNPGFELGTTGWTTDSGAFTLDVTTSHSGTNSIKLTAGGTWQSLMQYVNVNQNTYYTLSFYAKGPSGVLFTVFNASNEAITPQYYVTAGDTWTLNTVTFNSGGNPAVKIYLGDGDSSGGTHYFDDFAITPAAAPSPTPTPTPTPISGPSLFTSFITRSGDKLMDGDKELRFMSINVPCMLMEEDEGFTVSTPYEQEDAFKTIVQMGGEVIRTYTITIKSPKDTSGMKFHVMKPGVFDESFFRAMDQALALANKYGVRMVIPLVDQYSYHGGTAEYAAWEGYGSRDYFWTDPAVIADFEKTINYVLNRTNTITGVKYKDDKAILAWETGNEIISPPSWDATISSYIKSIDSNHLVMDGSNLTTIEPESLESNTIDIVSIHAYRYFGRDLCLTNASGRAQSIGKKPFIFGEFGLASTKEMTDLMDQVVNNGTSGAMPWSLRSHRENGGFYFHGESTLDNVHFYAYQWPSFALDDPFDNTQILNALRNAAYRIRGLTPPPLTAPDAPLMFPAYSATNLSWRGSAGASSYDIERAESPDGPWTVVKRDVSDALYGRGVRPNVNDRTVVQGHTYYYRVRAKNTAGSSAPSNVIGPFVATFSGTGSNNGSGIIDPRTTGFIYDEMNDLSRIYSYTGDIDIDTSNPQNFAGDTARLVRDDNNDASIIYAVNGNMNSLNVETYFVNGYNGSDIAFYASADGQNYTPFAPSVKYIGGVGTQVNYQCYSMPLNMKYLKVTLTGNAGEIGKVYMGYGNTALPVIVAAMPKVIDDFEGYQGDGAKLASAYTVDQNGNTAAVELDRQDKNDGNYGLMLNYTLNSTKNTAGIVRNLGNDDWSGGNNLQFWVKPNGSGNLLTFQIKEASGELWEASSPLSGTAPALVKIPFSNFVHPAGYTGGNGVFDLDSIASMGIYVKAGSGQSGSNSIALDSFAVVNIADPLVDNFEGYDNDSSKLQASYSMDGNGDSAAVALDSSSKNDGNYGMKLDYTVGAKGYAAVTRNLVNTNLSGYNAFQLWVQPDGSDRDLVIRIKEGSGEFWETHHILSGTTAQLITIPFANFIRTIGSNGNNKFETNLISGITVKVLQGNGQPGSGTIYLDSLSAVKTRMIDDFESYDNSELISRGAYTTSGGPLKLYPDSDNRNDGNYGLKYQYSVGTQGYTGMIKRIPGGADWSGADAIRFWLKPDGTTNVLHIQFKELIVNSFGGSDGEVWEATYPLTGTTAGFVTIPLSSFQHPGWYDSQHNPWDNGVIDLSSIGEFSIWVNKSTDPAETNFNSAIYLDSIKAAKFDETPPVITVEGVADGQAYNDSVIPVVKAVDEESGVKSLAVTADGLQWTEGTAVGQKGPHTLVATATDNEDNTATVTVQFTIYGSTSLTVDNATGIYSDVTPLRAVLKDKDGLPVSGETVTFMVDGAPVGTAVTDEQGAAVLDYKVNVGASPDVDTLDHTVQAVFAQDDTAYYRASVGSGVLAAGKEEASIAYTGSTLSPADKVLTLSACVLQQQDGEPGDLAGLPVQFTISGVNPDGTLKEYTDTVTQAVYWTDESGNVSVNVQLPAGLYEVRAGLLDNSYYKASETTETLAVYDASAGTAEADGWFALSEGNEVMGSKAEDVHVNAKWGYDSTTLLPEGSLKIHAEPQGLDLEMDAADWLVIAGDSAYMQGSAKDEQGNIYTVRLMLQDSHTTGKPQPVISIIIRQGTDTGTTPVFQALGQVLNGSIEMRQ